MAGALGVVITTDVPMSGQHAQPVYVDESLPIVGPSRAIVVTAGEVPQMGGPALAVRLAPAGTPALGPALPVYVVSGILVTLGATGAAFANGEVGNIAADTVVVNWTSGIVSPLADYTLGVTIKVNGVAATINSASRPSTTQTRYVLSAAVIAGDVITWEYNSGPGDLQTIATGVDVATISAQSITNSLTSGNSLDFSQAANSMYVPWAF